MNPADQMAAKPGTAGSDEKSDQQLHTILENLGRVDRGNTVGQDELHSGKRRGSRGFARFLVAICIGVAGTLAWQSYGEATKQINATSAPELGWSPETKQMIASWMQQLGWTKPLAVESKAAPVAQTAPETVAPKAPAAPSLDQEQVQQMARDLATMRQTVDRLAAGLDEVNREIGKLEVADEEILAKVTPAPPPPRPIAAPTRQPTPTTPPSSRAPIAPPHP